MSRIVLIAVCLFNAVVACRPALAQVTPIPVTPIPVTPIPVTPIPVTPIPTTAEPKSLFESGHLFEEIASPDESPIQTAGFITAPKELNDCCYPEWRQEVLPADLLYRSYLANPKDSRLASRILYHSGEGFIWALEAGARVGIWRYGTPSGWRNPYTGRGEGWQLDVHGAAFPRLNFEFDLDVDAADFVVGVPLTYSKGQWEAKVGWYHLSSHVGDEFLIRNPTFTRLNYLRDAFIFGGGYYPDPDLRLYGELEVAYNNDGGSDPIHIHLGFDWSPATVTPDIHRPQPFIAAHALLRQEVDFGGGINIVAGLAWRGPHSDRLFRAGIQYYNGKSWQFSFHDDHEELLGVSIWYDF